MTRRTQRAAAATAVAAALVASLVTLTLRWRRSKGDERQQLKWFLGAVALLPIPLLLHDAARDLSDALLSLAFVVIPVSLGVAVLRFRLYNLNLVVRRAAAYAVVSAVIAGTYLGIVAVVEAGVGHDASSGEHVIAAVAAAALFQPLRGLVQRVIDQVFYGDRLRPYEVMNRIGRQLEHAVSRFGLHRADRHVRALLWNGQNRRSTSLARRRTRSDTDGSVRPLKPMTVR